MHVVAVGLRARRCAAGSVCADAHIRTAHARTPTVNVGSISRSTLNAASIFLRFRDEDGFLWLHSLLNSANVSHVYVSDSAPPADLKRLTNLFSPDDYSEGEAPVVETPPRSAFSDSTAVAALSRLHGSPMYSLEEVRARHSRLVVGCRWYSFDAQYCVHLCACLACSMRWQLRRPPASYLEGSC